MVTSIISVKDIAEIEKQFSQNYYNGNITSDNYFDTIGGYGNILLSAPHSVNHWRDNRVKVSDLYTGTIIKILSTMTNSPAIFMTKFMEGDKIIDNYFLELKNIVSALNIRLVIDIHGMKERENIDIDIGTGLDYKFTPKNIVDKAVCIFKSNGILNPTVGAVFNANNPYTISYKVHENLNILSCQLEISKKYRDPINGNKEFLQMVNVLHNLIKEISLIL